MNILLDECIDRRLSHDIVGHDVKTTNQMGWATIKNGDLLTLAVDQFDVFITVDRNLSFQQNLSLFKIAVIVLHAKSSRLADLKLLVPKLLSTIPKAKPGVATVISN